MRTGIPYVSCQARTMWSLEAFDAEYGEWGEYGVFSVKKPVSPRVPYTSSVEMCWKTNASLSGRAFQYFSADCSRVAVPTTFVLTNSPGPSIDRSTCDSAARWNIVSGLNSAKAASIDSWSQMSFTSSLYFPSTSLSDSTLPA